MKRNLLSVLKDNLALKLVSVVIAFVIWSGIMNSNDPTRSITISNVPITIVNEDSFTGIGKVAEPQGNGTVTVKVTERKSVISRLSKTGSDFYVEADLENINEMNTVPLKVTCLNSSITWDEISISPASLKVKVEDKVEQPFAVNVQTSGNVSGNKTVGVTSIPDGKTILIAGPKSLVDIIGQVTAPIAIGGMRKDTTVTSTLKVSDKNGDEFTDVQMSLLEFKDSTGAVLADRQVQVDVMLWNIRSDIILKIDAEGKPAPGYYLSEINTVPQTISLAGTDTALADLDGVLHVQDTISIEGADNNVQKEIDISTTIAEIPDIKLMADADPVISVTAEIERSGDIMLSIPLGDIEVKNRPDNMKLVFTPADMVTFNVRWVSGDQREIGSEAVSASMDLAQCKAEGNYEIPVDIVIPEGFRLSSDVTIMVSAVPNAPQIPETEKPEATTEKESETQAETETGTEADTKAETVGEQMTEVYDEPGLIDGINIGNVLAKLILGSQIEETNAQEAD